MIGRVSMIGVRVGGRVGIRGRMWGRGRLGRRWASETRDAWGWRAELGR